MRRVSDYWFNSGQKLKERRFLCLPGSGPAPPAAAGVPMAEFPSQLQLWGGLGHRTRNSQPGAELHLEIQLPIPNPLCSSSLSFHCLHRSSSHLDKIPLPPGLPAHKDPTFLLPLLILSGLVFFLHPKETEFSRLCSFVSSQVFHNLLICPSLCL